jgi:ethanolaminephosphotransferase
VEGILTLCIVYAITAIKGGGWYWQQSVLQTLGMPRFDWIPESVWVADFGDFYMLYGGLVLAYNTIERLVPRTQRSRNNIDTDVLSQRSQCHEDSPRSR